MIKQIKFFIFISIVLALSMVALAENGYTNGNSQIRSEQSDVKSYFTLDAANGTVTNEHTGLIWKICVEGQTYNSINNTCNGTRTLYTSTEALAIVVTNDFRLPTAKELISIVDYSKYNPAISDIFPPDPSGFFATGYLWSSSRSYSRVHMRFAVSFETGVVFQFENKNVTALVRLVK